MTVSQLGPPRARRPAVPVGQGARRGLPLGGFLALAAVAYLMLAVGLWWGVWSSHPTTTAICGCGDPALFLWFLAWPAHALAHGLDPWASASMFHPLGVNLLSNTSVLALGVPLAPVTLWFGPVAAMNVASTLAPALSAVSMCFLVTRWVRWRPAAVIAGLLYGFSPFALTSGAGGYLMLSFLVVPPLVVACLDELVVRQVHPPWRVGMALGAALAVQFFLSTEVLAMVALVCALGLVVLAAGALAVGEGPGLAAHLPHAARGLGVAGAAGVVLLAGPALFAVAGPAHLPDPVWPQGWLPYSGNSVSAFWHLSYSSGALVHANRTQGGYQGAALVNPGYLGVGLLGVAGVGWVVWWRDRRLRFMGAMVVLAALLSLGASFHHWMPWSLFAGLPQMDNVIPSRFSILVDLGAAVMVGLVVDHVVAAVWGTQSRTLSPAWARSRRWLAAVAGLVVALVAVEPLLSAESTNLPLTVRPVVVPRWFTTVGTHLGPSAVVLMYPFTSSSVEGSLSWPAATVVAFQTPGGGGPGTLVATAGPDATALEVLGAASRGGGERAVPTAAHLRAVRQALRRWGVTIVVVPPQGRLPLANRGLSTPVAVAFFTAIVGAPPRRVAGSWVWQRVEDTMAQHPGRPLDQGAFTRCGGRPSPEAASACVLAPAG